MSEKSQAGLRVQTTTLNGRGGFWKTQGTVHELNLLYKHTNRQLSQEMPDDQMATLPLLGVVAVYYTCLVDLEMQAHFGITGRVFGIHNNISSLTRRRTAL